MEGDVIFIHRDITKLKVKREEGFLPILSRVLPFQSLATTCVHYYRYTAHMESPDPIIFTSPSFLFDTERKLNLKKKSKG